MLKEFFARRSVVLFLIFTFLGVAALQITLNNVAGSGARFTLFDSFAPIFSQVLGTGVGLISIFIAQFLNVKSSK